LFLDGELRAEHGGRNYPVVPMAINFNLWFSPGGLLPGVSVRRVSTSKTSTGSSTRATGALAGAGGRRWPGCDARHRAADSVPPRIRRWPVHLRLSERLMSPVERARLASVDALRGLTVAAMLLVNDAGDWGHVYAPLEHAAGTAARRPT
jgi:hypothetical protein